MAAKNVAAKLHALEEAIDDAIISAAELTAETPKARRHANVSPVVGQNAIALVGETAEALQQARALLVQAHEAFANVRDELGLKPRMTGDLWKIMKSEDKVTAANLRVVA